MTIVEIKDQWYTVDQMLHPYACLVIAMFILLMHFQGVILELFYARDVIHSLQQLDVLKRAFHFAIIVIGMDTVLSHLLLDIKSRQLAATQAVHQLQSLPTYGPLFWSSL